MSTTRGKKNGEKADPTRVEQTSLTLTGLASNFIYIP